MPEPDARLWWAIIRESARDVQREHESLALDGLEFLRGTGVWLCEYLWGIEPDRTNKELVVLVKRNRHLKERVDAAGG